MKLIIDIPKEAKQAFNDTNSYDLSGVIGKAIQNGIPLDNSHPVIINEDGKSAYLTQGHIDALLEYEDKQRQERVMRDVIDVIRKVNNNDPV